MAGARRTGLIAALDTADIQEATRWARAVGPHAGAIKLGLEFAYANGLPAVRQVADDAALFLDLKLHDIPNTVAGAMRSLAPVRAAMLTVHASGGRAMIEAARIECDAMPVRPLLLAVTVLTSLDAEALHETGIAGGPRQQVMRLARLALGAGADGLVCSPHEVTMLRDALGAAPVLVVPGVRPAGVEIGDQKRVMTPRQAAAAGADWIVVGRPITRAADPAAAAAAIAAELA
ncbi:orotidine-5'-phosphate decarboxylase [Lichenicoccus roseus]|uniref:Orotidine 5'-phosphate decarboxylase n=1 Tax=Lichenicoccus roseus TaxID=2683649 RepID=A0A5R9J3F4_9PROT|nr:orotidine-5'-phosphate decarboxylase [Lichenicoccus roseus]TLU71383.1 orotidine-5'-phosphate decarboxylase [Lichenicoccus roseus]